MFLQFDPVIDLTSAIASDRSMTRGGFAEFLIFSIKVRNLLAKIVLHALVLLLVVSGTDGWQMEDQA